MKRVILKIVTALVFSVHAQAAETRTVAWCNEIPLHEWDSTTEKNYNDDFEVIEDYKKYLSSNIKDAYFRISLASYDILATKMLGMTRWYDDNDSYIEPYTGTAKLIQTTEGTVVSMDFMAARVRALYGEEILSDKSVIRIQMLKNVIGMTPLS